MVSVSCDSVINGNFPLLSVSYMRAENITVFSHLVLSALHRAREPVDPTTCQLEGGRESVRRRHIPDRSFDLIHLFSGILRTAAV